MLLLDNFKSTDVESKLLNTASRSTDEESTNVTARSTDEQPDLQINKEVI